MSRSSTSEPCRVTTTRVTRRGVHSLNKLWWGSQPQSSDLEEDLGEALLWSRESRIVVKEHSGRCYWGGNDAGSVHEGRDVLAGEQSPFWEMHVVYSVPG